MLYDATTDAQKALSAVARTGERFGAGHLADLLVGEATEAMRRRGHDTPEDLRRGQERGRHDWIATVRQLFAAGALKEASIEHGGFRLTPLGEDILFGRRRSRCARCRLSPTGANGATRDAERAAASEPVLSPSAAALFQQLRELRHELAKAEGIAAYMVFADRTLIEMAERRPPTLAASGVLRGRRAQAPALRRISWRRSRLFWRNGTHDRRSRVRAARHSAVEAGFGPELLAIWPRFSRSYRYCNSSRIPVYKLHSRRPNTIC